MTLGNGDGDIVYSVRAPVAVQPSLVRCAVLCAVLPAPCETVLAFGSCRLWGRMPGRDARPSRQARRELQRVWHRERLAASWALALEGEQAADQSLISLMPGK